MVNELEELEQSLRGKSYELFCALYKTGCLDKANVLSWWQMLSLRERKRVKDRLILYLIQQRYGHSWSRFIRVWHRCSADQRRNIVRLYIANHIPSASRSAYGLIMEALKDGVPGKKDFARIWWPVQGRSRKCMKLCWFAYLEEGCEMVRVIRRGMEREIQLRLAPESLMSF